MVDETEEAMAMVMLREGSLTDLQAQVPRYCLQLFSALESDFISQQIGFSLSLVKSMLLSSSDSSCIVIFPSEFLASAYT